MKMKAAIQGFCELFADYWYDIPGILMMLGLGIFVAREYDIGADTGRILMVVGLFSGFLRVWLFPRYRIPEPRQGNTLQPEIDEVRKAGYRVWFLYPRTDEAATRSLFALREKGYVLTDQQGCLIDAASEVHDRPTQRRKSFRLVEMEAKE